VVKQNNEDVIEVHAIGRLVKDPELRQTSKGREFVVIRFSSKRRTHKGDVATLPNIVAFENAKEIQGKYNQGDKIEVRGRLVVDDYVGKDNVRKKSISIYTDNISLITKKKENTQEHATPEPEHIDEKASDELLDTVDEVDVESYDNSLDYLLG
jgi:single-stranded DNA-binding protein